MKIYRYQKQSDAYTVYQAQGEDLQELCTLDDGYTYISGPDVMPEQLPQVIIEEATLTDELREAIKTSSPQVRLINRRVVEKIRERYSVDDEFCALRTGDTDYPAYVEECLAWGAAEKAALGL
jgi:hypothetical protein